MSVNGAVVRISAPDLEWLRTADPGAIDEKTEGWFWSDNPRSFEMEKGYAGIHFLLTGVDSGGEGPLSFIGNQEYGEELNYEFAYGPARVFPPDSVKAIHRALQDLSPTVVKKRLKDPALEQVYPFSMRSVDEEDHKRLEELLEQLRSYVSTAADAGDAIMVAIL